MSSGVLPTPSRDPYRQAEQPVAHRSAHTNRFWLFHGCCWIPAHPLADFRCAGDRHRDPAGGVDRRAARSTRNDKALLEGMRCIAELIGVIISIALFSHSRAFLRTVWSRCSRSSTAGLRADCRNAEARTGLLSDWEARFSCSRCRGANWYRVDGSAFAVTFKPSLCAIQRAVAGMICMARQRPALALVTKRLSWRITPYTHASSRPCSRMCACNTSRYGAR